jgi:epoxyqueuosine reductase
MNGEQVKTIALKCGFDLAGIAPAQPSPEAGAFLEWVGAGMAGRMGYLTDRRADLRRDPRSLLPAAQSILCVGKLYNGPEPYTPAFSDRERGWISRYAWGEDYHPILRKGLERVIERLRRAAPDLEYKICVDTAPLLERSHARLAGLGWTGKNTCLINQERGSWFFLGEALLSLPLEADVPVEERCGSCAACIEACPTGALEPWRLDARLCISYLTIELRGAMPTELRDRTGTQIFGCDICQDVCPWNNRAAVTNEPGFAARTYAPDLARLAAITEPEFRAMFRSSPVLRAKYSGFLRNVVTAMGNSCNADYVGAVRRLIDHPDDAVREHAAWALARLTNTIEF